MGINEKGEFIRETPPPSPAPKHELPPAPAEGTDPEDSAPALSEEEALKRRQAVWKELSEKQSPESNTK